MKYAPVFLACALTVGLAAACSSDRSPSRRVINLPGKRADLPYSHGVVVGNTLYLGGRIGRSRPHRKNQELLASIVRRRSERIRSFARDVTTAFVSC
jgi:enamine deaminase RidA (YjgF/YER057c/UK114 family)